MKKPVATLMITISISAALSGCGGGGGGGSQIASVPPPPAAPPTSAPPPPAPAPAAAPVTIFATPIPETYATVGVARSLTGPITGSNLISFVFGVLSKTDTDQPHIRYSDAGYYEIQMPGNGWNRLVHSALIANPTSDSDHFEPSNVSPGQALLVIERARLSGYKYSELAEWTVGNSKAGEIAFGSSTPASAGPVMGSADYVGIVRGTSDLTQDNGFGPSLVPVTGDVKLSFDFGAGTLAGAMTVSAGTFGKPVALGTFTFKDTVFGVGSTTYSGAFDTPASGANYFFGQFTGPKGQEVIGAWALPFVYSVDGQSHQATGAWIAK